jgi:hypothetical protein
MLVLLDIDGVMVPAQSWKTPPVLEDGFPAFSETAVRVLQSILSEQTHLILTSSHKARFSIEEWVSIFERRGIRLHSMNILPDGHNTFSRKDEIIDWFFVNDIKEPFVILDDDKSLNDLPDQLKAHLVQTMAHLGLTDDHLSAIETILNGGLQPA